MRNFSIPTTFCYRTHFGAAGKVRFYSLRRQTRAFGPGHLCCLWQCILQKLFLGNPHGHLACRFKESLINENNAPRFSTRDWEKTPEPIKLHLIWLHEMVSKYEETITLLQARIESLEAKRNENSTNSNRPPSSDNPFNKPAGKS